MARALADWARDLPGGLLQMEQAARQEMRNTAHLARARARASVPVVTGDLQRSIFVTHEGDTSTIGTFDPAAQALADSGRPIVQTAIEAELRVMPERIIREWTEIITGRARRLRSELVFEGDPEVFGG